MLASAKPATGAEGAKALQVQHEAIECQREACFDVQQHASDFSQHFVLSE